MNGSNMDGTDAPKKPPDTKRKPSFQKPTRRCMYVIIAVLLVCIVACILLAVLLRSKSKDDCPKGIHCDWRSMPHSEFLRDERCDSLCTTRPCVRSAQYVQSRIDSSKDPCEDFYEFACGTYEQETVIFPEENGGVYTSQEMENEVLLNLKEIIDSIDDSPGKSSLALRLTKGLYDDCMETDHHPDVLSKEIWRQLFSENGRLPWLLLSENSRNDQKKHLVRMMASTLFFGVNPFFSLQDIRMATMNKKDFLVFRFVKSDDIHRLQSIHKEWTPEDEESISARYEFALGKIMAEVGANISAVEGIMPNIIEIENHFIALSTKAIEANEKVYENNRHLSYEYHNHSCQDLDHNMGNIKWCEIAKVLRKEYGFPNDTPFRIELPSLGEYFAGVNTVMGHYFDRHIINYIGVKFMLGFMKYMPSPLREIYYREKDLFSDQRTHLPLASRWQQCVQVITEFMALPLEREYLKEKLDEKARAKVREMMKKIKETHLSLLDKITWLKTALGGEDPKKLVREMKLMIGRSDELLKMDEAALDKFYSLGFDDSGGMKASHPLLLDVLAMKEFNTKISMVAEVDDQHISTGSKFFTAMDTDRLEMGEIGVGYRLLAFPMYLPGRPMYAEYANLGTTISTYIMTFLLTNMKPGNSTVQAFKDATNCLSEQSHLYKTGNVKYKGDELDDFSKLMYLLFHTLGTHGSFQSYADYLKQNGDEKGLPGLPFTNEQLFFISAAQAHCEKFTEKGYVDLTRGRVYPARYRVNVPFAHLKEFSEAFRCPVDSSMNLKRRCCILGDGKLSRDCK